MLLRTTLAGVALACLLATPISAEIFRYTDEEGTIHFVSSEDQIPPRYRNFSGRAAGGSVGRVDSEVVESPAQSAPTNDRLRELRRRNQHRNLPARVPGPIPRQPQPPGKEPRKYITDCSHRNKNGRCGRRRSPGWDDWNRKRIQYEQSQPADE